MLNNDFGPQFGGMWTPDLSFVYSNPVPLDREAARADKLAEAQVYALLVNAGEDPIYAAQVAGLPEPPPRPAIVATVPAATGA
jgi:hypothetical protein